MNDRKQHARNQLLTKLIEINDQFTIEHGQVVKHGVDGVDGSDGRHGDAVNFNQTGITTFDTSKVTDIDSNIITYGPMIHPTVRLTLTNGVPRMYNDMTLGHLGIHITQEHNHTALCRYTGTNPFTITIPISITTTGDIILKKYDNSRSLPAGTHISFNSTHAIA